MEKLTITAELAPAEQTESSNNSKFYSGMTLDEMYHEASEAEYLDRLTSVIDYYEMNRKEGNL